MVVSTSEGRLTVRTDAMNLDPGVAGLAGLVADPTNLIPGAAFSKGGQAVVKGAREGAELAARAGGAAVEGLAMMPMGIGGVGGGGARRGKQLSPDQAKAMQREIAEREAAEKAQRPPPLKIRGGQAPTSGPELRGLREGFMQNAMDYMAKHGVLDFEDPYTAPMRQGDPRLKQRAYLKKFRGADQQWAFNRLLKDGLIEKTPSNLPVADAYQLTEAGHNAMKPTPSAPATGMNPADLEAIRREAEVIRGGGARRGQKAAELSKAQLDAMAEAEASQAKFVPAKGESDAASSLEEDTILAGRR